MQGTPSHPPAPRRRVASPLPDDLRSRLRAELVARAPEALALAAEVSLATVCRAAAGRPVRPVVRAALARAVSPPSSPAAAA